MSGGPLDRLIRCLRRATRAHPAGALADADLLQRWSARRDAAAFEVLLWRHGPMVLGLCRRLLRDPRDVEDPFQATFLALVRRAGAIRRPEAIRRGEAGGSWLFRVAYRAALRARAEAPRARPLDPRALEGVAAGPGPEPGRDELRAVLDEEVSRLPARYRVPLILCYFQGKTNDEAARELGCAAGTVASRLGRRRRRVAVRLGRRRGGGRGR